MYPFGIVADHMGGGSEVLVLQRRFSNITVTDTEVSPTIEAGGGEGGNNLPMIVEPIVFKDDITIKIDEGGGGFHPWRTRS